jgi:hypothetical protein
MRRIQAKPANTAQKMPLPKHAVLNSSLNTDELQTFELDTAQAS